MLNIDNKVFLRQSSKTGLKLASNIICALRHSFVPPFPWRITTEPPPNGGALSIEPPPHYF